MAPVTGRALQWHWLDLDGPEMTEQWSERVSLWIGLSVCMWIYWNILYFLGLITPFFLPQVPVPQANFMEDIEKWLSTDVVSEGLLSWSQQSCWSWLWAGLQAVCNSAGSGSL